MFKTDNITCQEHSGPYSDSYIHTIMFSKNKLFIQPHCKPRFTCCVHRHLKGPEVAQNKYLHLNQMQKFVQHNS
jgi:hypothetical protein